MENQIVKKAELLDGLNRPRTQIDAIFICTAVLGLLGCLSESQALKILSLSILLGSVGTLLCNMMTVRAYAGAALIWLEQNLDHHRYLLSLSEHEVSKLNQRINEWEKYARQKCNEVEQLKLRLQQAQESLRNAQEQIRETNYQNALLQNKVDAQQEQIQWFRKR